MRFKLLIAALALMPALVSAQNAPNMIGTWTGIFHAAIMGSGSHHLVPNKKDKDIHFNKIPFTLDIDRQDGVNFSGSLATKNRKEVIVGVIAPDFQGGVMVDEDGTHSFKIVDPTTIQNCYVQISKPKVASCWVGKKQ